MVRFRKIMHDAHAPAEVVNAAVKFHFEELVTSATTAETKLLDYNDKGDKLLKNEWGADFDKNVEFAKRGWGTLPEGARLRLDAMGFDADPELKRFFATLGRNMGEDGMIDSGLPEDRKATLEARLAELEGSKNRWDQPVNAEIEGIRKQLWPGNFNRHVA